LVLLLNVSSYQFHINLLKLLDAKEAKVPEQVKNTLKFCK